MIQNMRPLLDRVLIQRLPQEERSEGGIIIPDTAKEKGQTGKVLAVGQGRLVDGKNMPMTVQVDDIVFLSKYAGTEISSDLVIVREEDILAVIKKS